MKHINSYSPPMIFPFIITALLQHSRSFCCSMGRHFPHEHHVRLPALSSCNSCEDSCELLLGPDEPSAKGSNWYGSRPMSGSVSCDCWEPLSCEDAKNCTSSAEKYSDSEDDIFVFVLVEVHLPTVMTFHDTSLEHRQQYFSQNLLTPLRQTMWELR